MATFTYKFLLDELKRHYDERHARYEEMRARVMEKSKTVNKGLEPIFDNNGCPHAPCDGYVFTRSAWVGDLSDEWDEVYAGGQFLPWDSEIGLSHSVQVQRKVLFPETVYQEMKDKMPSWVRFVNKVWFNKETGFENRFLWLIGEEWLVNHLEKIVAAHFEQAVKELVKPEKPPKGIAPVGKVLVSGTVLATKIQESMYGESLKMLVELENYSTVWGSVPAKFCGQCQERGLNYKGTKVQFEAQFEQAQDDKTHSFFKRPTKVTVLTSAVSV